jgi:hypothetical protein
MQLESMMSPRTVRIARTHIFSCLAIGVVREYVWIFGTGAFVEKYRSATNHLENADADWYLEVGSERRRIATAFSRRSVTEQCLHQN